MIPKIISHIWLQGKDDIPNKYDNNYILWETMHPSWKHMIWDENSTIELVKLHIPEYLKYIIETDTLINKVNIIKYLNLYFYGGVYVDLDSFPLHTMEELFNENEIGNIDIDSRISFRYPYNKDRDFNKKICEYDIIVPCRNSLMFYPDSSKILLFDNPFLVSTSKNNFWLELIKYCNQRKDLKLNPGTDRQYLPHEPYGPYGLTDFIYTKYNDVYKNNIMILPHYFVFSDNSDKYDKKYIIHQAESSWK